MNDAVTLTATTYSKLISLLDDARVRYRLIDHAPEGRTVEASILRGHPARQAAKCMVARINLTKRTARRNPHRLRERLDPALLIQP